MGFGEKIIRASIAVFEIMAFCFIGAFMLGLGLVGIGLLIPTAYGFVKLLKMTMKK